MEWGYILLYYSFIHLFSYVLFNVADSTSICINFKLYIRQNLYLITTGYHFVQCNVPCLDTKVPVPNLINKYF